MITKRLPEEIEMDVPAGSVPTKLEDLENYARGTTAERPTGLGAGDIFVYEDTDTEGLVFWKGTKWSDQ